MGYLPLAILSMVSIGVYYFLVKILATHIHIVILALINNSAALLVIYLYLYLNKVSVVPKKRKGVLYSLLISLPLAIGAITLYLALDSGPVSIVIPIIGMHALVAVILGIIILREKVTLRKGLGVLMAMGAIILLSL
jgi:transporter family protein